MGTEPLCYKSLSHEVDVGMRPHINLSAMERFWGSLYRESMRMEPLHCKSPSHLGRGGSGDTMGTW